MLQRKSPIVSTSDVETGDPRQVSRAALAELEAIVETMEGGQLPLAESLTAYKRGAELLAVLPNRAARTRNNRFRYWRRGVLNSFAPDIADPSLAREDDES